METLNYAKCEKPHIYVPDYGQGETIPIWRQFRRCSDGRYVIGYGETITDVCVNTLKLLEEHERYLALSDRERLKILLDGSLLQTDLQDAVRIIGKIVLGDNCETET